MDTHHIARRFPLVPRPRPPCPPLHVRVREVHQLAKAATSGPDPLSQAASAHNKAALIASDCGLPDLARTLCWRHFRVFAAARPLGGKAARHALEPLVNLARIHIRGGDGDAAHTLLTALYQAITTRADAVIDTTPVPLRDLIQTEDDHYAVRQWLWAVILAEGTRALVRAGRWTEALAHAQQRRGIGQRLLDGRQVAILTACLAGDPAAALVLLDETTATQPWEKSLAACLTVLCHRIAAPPTPVSVQTMIEGFHHLEPSPTLLMFRTRLGLTALDLAADAEPAATSICDRLIGDVVAAADAYAARELLSHRGCADRLTTTAARGLATAVDAAGLHQGHVPTDLMAALLASVALAEAAETRDLAGASAKDPQPTDPVPAEAQPPPPPQGRATVATDVERRIGDRRDHLR
jgi:hypothetical protein